MSPTREKYPLSTKKIIKKTIMQSISCSVFMGIFLCIGVVILIALAGQATAYLWGAIIGIVVLWIIFIILIYLYQRWYFATYYYEIKADSIVIKKDPITPKEINIVYQKIQDVYVDQDFLDRMFGLYDVHLATATFSSGNLAHIDGLEKTAADGLRDELLTIFKNKVNKQ